jgi:hypothetical protein
LEKDLRGRVIELIRFARFDQADFVGDLREMRQHFGKLGTALPMAREFELRAEHRGIGPDESVALAANDRGREGLAGEFGELRLVIEEFQLTWRARHEEVDHPLRPAGKMSRQRIGGGSSAGRKRIGQERGESDLAHADSAVPQKMPA